MILKRFGKKILAKIAPSINNANNLHLDEGYRINEYSQVNGATLYGKVSIGKGVKIINGVKIVAKTPVTIGRYSSLIGPGTEINSSINSIQIGSFCSIAKNVFIQEYNHKHNRLSTYYIFKNIFNEHVGNDIESKGDIIIGNDVWIGTNSTILSGIKIGHGAVIAANSVVNKDVPNFSIVGGAPAKLIKKRFEKEIVDRLLQIKWWDWDLEKIKKNKILFESPLTSEKLDNIQ